MKRLILVLFTSLGLLESNAQDYPPAPGTHIPDNELNKFMGTWQWVSGSDTVLLKLYKQEVYVKPPGDYYFEQIVGWHKYVKNGIVQESSVQFTGQPFMAGNSTFLGGSRNKNNLNQLIGTFRDITKNRKGGDLYLTMTNSSLSHMTWKLKESRGVKSGNFLWGFTLPVDLVLTRQ